MKLINIFKIEFYVYFLAELDISNIEFHLNYQKKFKWQKMLMPSFKNIDILLNTLEIRVFCYRFSPTFKKHSYKNFIWKFYHTFLHDPGHFGISILIKCTAFNLHLLLELEVLMCVEFPWVKTECGGPFYLDIQMPF